MKTLYGTYPPDKLAQLFDAFLAVVFPDVQNGSAQYRDMRMLFFVGSQTMFECTMDVSEHPNEDICEARLELLHREILSELKDISDQATMRRVLGERTRKQGQS